MTLKGNGEQKKEHDLQSGTRGVVLPQSFIVGYKPWTGVKAGRCRVIPIPVHQ